jgi:pSer/pThr/pTyr-binding forkhead associated (FHA) protein
MSVKLKVVQGKPHGSVLDFPEGEFVVGRGPECHVRPNSELISRQHCLLRVHGHDVHVRDLGSTNGTLVNGKLLVEECALAPGDTLQLGPLVLELIMQEVAARPVDEAAGSSDTVASEFHHTIETDPPSDAPIPPKG